MQIGPAGAIVFRSPIMRDRHRDKFFAPSETLIYTTWVIHHVSAPRYSSADNGAGDGSRTPISWRNRFSRRALVVHPFRGGSTSARRRRFGLEFEPLPLEIPEKALSAELEVVEFSGPVITGKNVLSRKKTSSDYVLGIGSVRG